MSEKYITLNHLETATKSLIAKIDEEINDLDETLSPVAKSGDYEDLENKPNIISDYDELNNTPNIFEIEFHKTGNAWYCSQTYSDINTAINNSAIIIAKYYNTSDHVDFKEYAYSSDFNTYSFYFVESTVDKEDNIIRYTDITFTIDSNDTVSYVETDNSYPIGNNSTPDWDQNDSAADDYIENRTHWKEIDENFVWVDNESFKWTSDTSNFGDTELIDSYLNTNLSFILDKEYTVIFDNTTYKLTSYSGTYSNNNTYAVLGNSNYTNSNLWSFDNSYNTDVPFFLYPSSSGFIRIWRGDTSSDSTEHIVSITGPREVYHYLDNQYLDGKLIKIGTGAYSEIFNNGSNIASGSYSHAEGNRTTASSSSSHSEGRYTTASGAGSHSEGGYTTASGAESHSEGYYTTASGPYSHAENTLTIATAQSHSEGVLTTSTNRGSHSEGTFIVYNSQKISKAENSLICTFSEPFKIGSLFKNATTENNVRIKRASYTDNYRYYWKIKDLVWDENDYLTQFTIDEDSNSIGISYFKTLSVSNDTISILLGTLSSGIGSHAEGQWTYASGSSAHAENRMTHAIGNYSHTEGYYTIASSESQHVQGKYNILDTNNVYADIVGNGTAYDARSNAYTLDWSGNGVYAGKVTVGTAPTADMDVATKLYVDTTMSNVSTDLVGLTDTTITTPTDGQILIYDATNSKWINSNFTAVSAESDTNVNDMLDSFSLDYTSNTLSPNLWVGGSY